MAIGSVMLHWFARLHQRGVFRGDSVLELGPSSVTASKHVCDDFFRAVNAPSSDRPKTRDIYSSIGITSYESIDRSDGVATYRHDLNEPLSLDRQYDIVAEFGTLEHVFNIGLCLKTMHDHLKVGGCALHVLPARGDFNHGFYNIHSTFYRDLAEANEYEIVDLVYVPDHQQQNMTLANEGALRKKQPPRMIDIAAGDATWRELEFARDSIVRHRRRMPRSFARAVFRLFKPAKRGPAAAAQVIATGDGSQAYVNPRLSPLGAYIRRTLGEDVEVYDYIFAALRKTKDAPFRYPQQGAYRLPVS